MSRNSTKPFSPNFSSFHNEELTSHFERCKFIASILNLKHAFANCRTFHGRLCFPSPEEDYDDPNSDYNDEQEEFVSEIRSRYMEAKSKRKANPSFDRYWWALSPTGEIVMTPKPKAKGESDSEEKEDFFSVGSCFSPCSSATNMEEFQSVKTNFPCSSLSNLELPDFRKQSIIWELCHCEGWPFGLCRKALLLPPLPKSPSESWSWRHSKSGPVRKLP